LGGNKINFIAAVVLTVLEKENKLRYKPQIDVWG